jgi:hypothetical protein
VADVTTAAVVGGGPAGLMAAEVLGHAGVRVIVIERMPSVGRKLLLAGRGGLNLTHSEPLDGFLARYGEARPRLEAAIAAFGPDDLRAWCAGLGQEPFVGSSGRVFPSGFRATPLLRAWLARLDELGVERRLRCEWAGFDDASTAGADVTVLALGGASWPRTGSNGAWVPLLAAAGVDVRPLRPANSGFAVAWSAVFRERFAGVPLKDVGLTFEGRAARGDVVVTDAGIEGGPVYALSAALRGAIERHGAVELTIDLRPDASIDDLEARLARARPGDSTSNALRRAGLAPIAIGLLRETGVTIGPAALKAVPVRVDAPLPLARAISTAGGIALDEVDGAFMLRRRPGTFIAGEMLDWEAPTGGYLLQATFSTAVAAADGAIRWLAARSSR